MFLERLTRALSSNASNWKIIVPLTATDRTLEILNRYSVESVEPFKVPKGLGLAYSIGLSKALDHPGPVLTMDTDLSHLPEEMDRLLSADGDLILGAREDTKAAFHRRLASRTVNAVLRGPHSDYTSAYRLYSRSVLEKVLPSVKSKGFAFLPEIVFRALHAGFKVSEVRVSFPPRIAGTSKMSYRANLNDYLRFLAWRYRP